MMTTKSAEDYDLRTQFTAGDALLCKHSAVTKGYFKDDFITAFVNLESSPNGAPTSPMRKPPIINRGYFARVFSIDQTINKFLSSLDPRSKKQIISLGSGFDTLSLQLLQKNDENLHIFEIDFEKIIKRKIATCLSNPTIRNLLTRECKDNVTSPDINIKKGKTNGAHDLNDSSASQNIKEYSFDNVHFLSSDLRNPKAVVTKLLLAGLDATAPTLIITECVMVYLEKEHSEKLCADMSSMLKDAAWVTYDMIAPNDIFGKAMLRNITSSGFRIPGFEDYPTLDSQVGRFLNNGWCEARSTSMLSVYNNWLSLEDKNRIAKLEIFDEIEEWQMLMCHYSLTVAVKGTMLLSVLPEPLTLTTRTTQPAPETVTRQT